MTNPWIELFPRLIHPEVIASSTGVAPLYPCVIVPARYGGAYEHNAWLAFPFSEHFLFGSEYDGGDIECHEFWYSVDRLGLPIGRGIDPNDALDDMADRLQEWEGGGDAMK